jgi:RNA polymerase sigma-70 factor (ECF subfamily)
VAPGPNRSAEQSNPADLVARIRNGDRAAEEELVARYSRGVAMILRRGTRSQQAVDDLFQEVFLKAMAKVRAGEVREPERLSGFIAGLARNLAIDSFRRNSAAESQVDSGAGESVPDRTDGPLERVLRIEDEHRVRRVMSDLPSARDRALLFRFYLAEDDKEEICADLKLSSLQFNRVLHRARERFRELYQGTARRAPEREG